MTEYTFEEAHTAATLVVQLLLDQVQFAVVFDPTLQKYVINAME